VLQSRAYENGSKVLFGCFEVQQVYGNKQRRRVSKKVPLHDCSLQTLPPRLSVEWPIGNLPGLLSRPKAGSKPVSVRSNAQVPGLRRSDRNEGMRSLQYLEDHRQAEKGTAKNFVSS
jgi:hypothetical protein